MTSLMKWIFLLALGYFRGVQAYFIDASQTSLTLRDSRTGMIAHTMFIDEAIDAYVDGLLWKDLLNGVDRNTTEVLNYRTFLNGKEVYTGYLALPSDPDNLPTSLFAGVIFAKKAGKTNISIEFWVGETMDSVSTQLQAFQKWLASIPMMLVFLLGFIRNIHVIYALMVALFVGSCMVTGEFISGFKAIITRYIMGAVSEPHHIYIFTFAIVAAGLAAMIRRSGGISAMAQKVSSVSGSMVFGNMMIVIAGLVLFFDPYASIIFITEFLSPYFRLFPVSIEKYAFLIQSTGVPVSAINPLSTWLGFSSSLIQAQIEQLISMGYEDLNIDEDGLSVFIKSIKYQFYPIFLLSFVLLMTLTRRDMGPMLIMERKRWLMAARGELPEWSMRETIARPEDHTPRKAYNMYIPTSLWVVAVGIAFGVTNDPDSENSAEDFMGVTIYCTFGVAALTQFFYLFQRKSASIEEGDAGHEKVKLSTNMSVVTVNIQDEAKRSPYVSLHEGAQCFYKGGAVVVPTLMTLTLAWATTEVFLELGLDRLFADLINQGNIRTEVYPTLGFIISFLLALTTGSSAAAQTIVLPLLATPIYVESDGNAELFYALVGAVMSGSVVGDHISPISASTILSTLNIECDLRDHILTQTPYILFVALLSAVVGHLPSAYESFPFYASYILALFFSLLFLFIVCENVLNEEGKYDWFTQQCCYARQTSLRNLKREICFINGIDMEDSVLSQTRKKNAKNSEDDRIHDTESASQPDDGGNETDRHDLQQRDSDQAGVFACYSSLSSFMSSQDSSEDRHH